VLERNAEGYRGYAKLFCNKQKDHAEPEDIWMQHKHIRPEPNIEGSIVLIETQAPGEEAREKQAAEEEALVSIIQGLMEDPTYSSDRARARELAKLTNTSETAAQTKIHRARKNAPTKEQIAMELEIAK
jgi:hypothetical protein